jgi:hypothetical protein
LEATGPVHFSHEAFAIARSSTVTMMQRIIKYAMRRTRERRIRSLNRFGKLSRSTFQIDFVRLRKWFRSSARQ